MKRWGEREQLANPRWPSILTNIVSTISGVNHASDGAKLAEGKAIITKISALKHGMGRNAVLEYVCVGPLTPGQSPMTEAPTLHATTMRSPLRLMTTNGGLP